MQQNIFNFYGLVTSNSDIAAPPGSFKQLMNVDSSLPGLLQPRRGFDLLNAFSDTGYRSTSLWDYAGYLYSFHNGAIYNYVSGSWVSRGSVTKPTYAKVPRTAFMNNNLYVLTSAGLKKTDTYTTDLYEAGLPAGTASTLTESTATGTAVATAKTVNYRWIITKRDANSNLIQGPVSPAASYANSSGAQKDTCLIGYLPTELDGTETVQIYRSQGLAAVTDEMQLCYEYPLNASNLVSAGQTFETSDVATGTDIITITAHGFQDGTVLRFTTTGGLPAGLAASTDYVVSSATTDTFKLTSLAGAVINITTTGSGTHTATNQVAFGIFDVTPDAVLGASLYTSPSQYKISQSNIRPPLAQDIASYKGYLFYSDTESKHGFEFTLISCSGASGALVSSDTITIGAEVYTAGASESYGSGSGTFKLTSASGSVSTDLDSTSRSIVDVINRSSLLYTAQYIRNSDSDVTGHIRIETKTLGASSFGSASSRSSAFAPQLPSVATSSTTSTNDQFRNGLSYSRKDQPEAVPTVNQFKVGTASDPILRIAALRDALIIFKAKDGAFVLRGESPADFTVRPLDNTAKLVAPESLINMNNLLYGLFENGICSVSDTSVAILSDNVKDKIQNLYGTALQQTKDYTFGIPYVSENKYILALPSSAADTSSTYQLVYNANIGSFEEWDMVIGAGYLSSEDQKLYVAAGDSSYVKSERKNYDNTDFADYLGTKTITSYSSHDLVVSGIDDFNVGDYLEQGSSDAGAYVTAIDLINSTITVDYARTWTTGVSTVDHYVGVNIIIELNPIFGDAPAGLKHFSEATFHYKQPALRTQTYTFSSDTTPSAEEVEVAGSDSQSVWGFASWGNFPWGGGAVPEPVRVGVPRNTARCNALSIKFSQQVALSDFLLEGISANYNPMSTRVSK